jgi:hypothetical protein
MLIFLDFNLNLGNSQIGLIPDFAGYLVMINGLKEMSVESPMFMKVKPFASAMAVYTAVLYAMELFGISSSLGAFSYILAIASTIISLYISYYIVMGVMDLEEKYSTLFNGSGLKSTWTLLAVFNILSFISLVVPVLSVVFIVVAFIVAIVFLVSFNTAKRLYYEAAGHTA